MRCPFQKFKQELSPQAPGLLNLSPMRWTVRALSLESIRLNYETLHATCEEAVSIVRDSQVKVRINGVAAMMKSFKFFFGLMQAERILKHTDNLSKTHQHSTISAVEAHSDSQLSMAVLQKMRTDLSFDQFWAIVQLTQQSYMSVTLQYQGIISDPGTMNVLLSHNTLKSQNCTTGSCIFN